MTRKKPSLKRKSAKPPKARLIEHVSLGPCTVAGVFLTDAGGIVADVDVASTRRTLSLDPQFWLSDISTLALEAVKRKPVKPEAEEPSIAEPDDDADDAAHAEELVVDGGHIHGDSDAAVDEDEDVEREDGELVSADVLR